MSDMENLVDWACTGLIIVGILCVGVVFVGATVWMLLRMFS